MEQLKWKRRIIPGRRSFDQTRSHYRDPAQPQAFFSKSAMVLWVPAWCKRTLGATANIAPALVRQKLSSNAFLIAPEHSPWPALHFYTHAVVALHVHKKLIVLLNAHRCPTESLLQKLTFAVSVPTLLSICIISRSWT